MARSLSPPLAPRINSSLIGTIRFNSRLIRELQQSLQSFNQIETQSSIETSDCFDDSTELSIVNASDLLSSDGSQRHGSQPEYARPAARAEEPPIENWSKLFQHSKNDTLRIEVVSSGRAANHYPIQLHTPSIPLSKKPTVIFRNIERTSCQGAAKSVLSKRQRGQDESKPKEGADRDGFPLKIQKRE